MRLLPLLLLVPPVVALRARAGWPSPRTQPRLRRAAVPPLCCICINCKFVDRCSTYHWVETQHEQPHVTETPDFEPNDPQIQVFIRNEKDEAEALAAAGESPAELVSRTLTTEFDVFECDAFSEDQGKWLRLMPDAGFIPT